MRDTYILSKQEIEEMKERVAKYPWAKNLYEKLKNDRSFENYDIESITGGNIVNDYVWKEGHWLRDKALVYLISGDDGDIPKMLDVLKHRFFEKWSFPNYQEFKHLAIPLGFEYMVDYWMLWLYLSNHVYALSLIKDHPSFTPELLADFEEKLFEMKECKKNGYDKHLHLYNCQFWDITCLGMLGILLEDDEAVRMAIDGKYGFKFMLERFFDGYFWPEPVGYSIGYIASNALMLAEGCLKNGFENLYEYVTPNGVSLKTMFDGFIRMMLADGRLANCGAGSQSAEHVSEEARLHYHYDPDHFLFNYRGNREENKFEIAYKRYKDPVYAWILSQQPDRDFWDHSSWGYAGLTHGEPLGETKAPSAKSEIYHQYGAALMRSDQTDSYWFSDGPAVYVRDGSRQGHSHHDPLHIQYHAFKKNIYVDWFYGWDYKGDVDSEGKPRNKKSFSGNIVGHNTVMVDAKEPEHSNVKFHFIRDDDVMQFLRSDNSVEGAAYKGIFETRYLGLTDEYLLDIVELKSNEEHTYDYLLHSLGSLSAEGLSDVEETDHKALNDEYGFEKIDTIAKRDNNVWIRPGSKGIATADWKAVFFDPDDDIGCNAFMLNDVETEVFLTNAPYDVSFDGWDDAPDGADRERSNPFLIVRRKAAFTMFIAIHQPFMETAPPMQVSREGTVITIQGDGFKDTFDLLYMSFERNA